MASQQDRDYLRRIAEGRLDAVSFLSGHRKPEQECRACAAFLRGLGIPFLVAELKSVEKPQDPPDVLFRDGRIEVCEDLNEGRKRHDEARALAQQAQQVQTPNDVGLPIRPERSPLSLAEAYHRVAKALAKKTKKYPATLRAELDILVCIQLVDKFLRPALPLPPDSALRMQGWRSVSFIMWPYSHVIYASKAAPAFLQEHRGQISKAWPDHLSGHWFSLDPALDGLAPYSPPETAT